MGAENKTIDDVFVELRKTTETLHQYVDKKVEEARKNSSGEANSDTIASIEKVNDDITALRKQYDTLLIASQRPAKDERNDEVTAEMELRQGAYLKFLRHGGGETGRSLMSAEEVRALSSASDADGGFLVPTEWESGLIKQAYDDGELRSLIGSKPTSRDAVQMAALAKPVVAWGTTNIAVDPQDLAAGGQRITIHDLKALVLIHNNTLEDADADIWAELSEMFSMAVAEAEDDAFAIGSGAGVPQGIVSDPRVQALFTNSGIAGGLVDGTHNGIDTLITAMYKLKKTYRRNASWAMNSITESAIRQVKDVDSNYGQYIWQPPVQAGDPATLLGKPVINPEGMPGITAGTFPIVIGDFRRGYRIRDRKGITIQRLVERYAEYDQTGFIVKRRTGGQVVLPEAFQTIKIST